MWSDIDWMSVRKSVGSSNGNTDLEMCAWKRDWNCTCKLQAAIEHIHCTFIESPTNEINETITDVTFSLPFWHTNCYFVQYFFFCFKFALISLNEDRILNNNKSSTDWKFLIRITYSSRLLLLCSVSMFIKIKKNEFRSIQIHWRSCEYIGGVSNGNFSAWHITSMHLFVRSIYFVWILIIIAFDMSTFLSINERKKILLFYFSVSVNQLKQCMSWLASLDWKSKPKTKRHIYNVYKM